MNFEQIKKNYTKGLWSDINVNTAVIKGLITKEQFKEITGADFIAPNSTSTLSELDRAKLERAKLVEEIVVMVDDMYFDGDETSQERMSRTITAAQAAGADLAITTTTWVLHDNTIAQPTIAQLARALKLAGEEQTRLWTTPYDA